MAPETLVLGVLVLAVTLYALLGGADFGAGVWELATGLRAGSKERALSYRAIGPVWEANHVWLIFLLVGLWTAFPPAFAALCRALWLPLFLALAGIVFRGAAYAFRSAAEGREQRQRWEAVFALASTLTPLFLGAAAGALARGDLGLAADGSFDGSTLTGWVSATAVFAGLFAVATCGYLAAVYLVREATLAGEDELAELWRRRALGAGVAMGALSWIGLAVVAFDADRLWAAFRARALPLVVLAGAGGVGSLAALARRRAGLAVAGAGLAVTAVIGGWAVAQHPLLVPPLTIEATKAPDVVLWTMVWFVAGGLVLLVPALGTLFWLFKTAPNRTPSEGR